MVLLLQASDSPTHIAKDRHKVSKSRRLVGQTASHLLTDACKGDQDDPPPPELGFPPFETQKEPGALVTPSPSHDSRRCSHNLQSSRSASVKETELQATPAFGAQEDSGLHQVTIELQTLAIAVEIVPLCLCGNCIRQVCPD